MACRKLEAGPDEPTVSGPAGSRVDRSYWGKVHYLTPDRVRALMRWPRPVHRAGVPGH
jgi:hypothetical protein